MIENDVVGSTKFGTESGWPFIRFHQAMLQLIIRSLELLLNWQCCFKFQVSLNLKCPFVGLAPVITETDIKK